MKAATFKLWESAGIPSWRVWVVVRPGSFWIGAHWSAGNRRLCVNVIPCWTIAIVFPRGIDPDY